MKIELLRNCSHGSEIGTYLSIDDFGNKKIIKASTTQSGIENLRNEVEGWRWYQSLRIQSKEPICRITQQKDKYLQISIEYIDGIKPAYQHGLIKNVDEIKKIVHHYCKIWPYSTNLVPLHGDLSLDNILINGEVVHIIDWEHYKANVVPWGFDIMYLLLETLYFSMRSRGEPKNSEIKIVCEQINTIRALHQLHTDMLKAPLHFIRDFISTHQNLWGEQLLFFQMKLPIFAFSSELVRIIDKKICLGLT